MTELHFVEKGSDVVEGIYTTKTDGSDLTRVKALSTFEPVSWSPNGDRLAVQDGNGGILTFKSTDGRTRSRSARPAAIPSGRLTVWRSPSTIRIPEVVRPKLV